jgi:hypothetical protein
MKKPATIGLTAAFLLLASLAVAAVVHEGPQAQAGPQLQAGPALGEAAPTFALPDTYGESHALEQYRGQWVVLEWLNYGCPYVKKHYRTGNIPGQQEKWRDRGVVWLAVVSSAPGEQGHYEPAKMNVQSEKMGNNASAVLLDPAGSVGRMYGARTTPHMFVIDPEGTVVYMGGIDDVPTPRDGDLGRATQLVDVALEEATAGQPISTPTSRPYGCNVKYR